MRLKLESLFKCYVTELCAGFDSELMKETPAHIFSALPRYGDNKSAAVIFCVSTGHMCSEHLCSLCQHFHKHISS